jgi:hypothetical protein
MKKQMFKNSESLSTQCQTVADYLYSSLNSKKIGNFITKELHWFPKFFLNLFVFLALSVGSFAQESIERPQNMAEEQSNKVYTSSLLEYASYSPDMKELATKINVLLKEVRSQLMDASNKQWFSENLQSSLSAKSAQVCTNIALVDLMLSTDSFILTPEMDKQELLYVIDFLNVSINGMLTK